MQYLLELGAQVEVRRNDDLSVEAALGLAPRGILIGPGPCDPPQAGISVPLIRTVAAQGGPVLLGVCLGHQSIGAAFGATVTRAPEVRHGKTSPIVHDGQGVFRGLPSPFLATRYHSLVVDEASLPAELAVSAHSGDDNLVMGVRHVSLPVEGVQFHPESILSEHGHALLRNFLDSCTD